MLPNSTATRFELHAFFEQADAERVPEAVEIAALDAGDRARFLHALLPFRNHGFRRPLARPEIIRVAFVACLERVNDILGNRTPHRRLCLLRVDEQFSVLDPLPLHHDRVGDPDADIEDKEGHDPKLPPEASLRCRLTVERLQLSRARFSPPD